MPRIDYFVVDVFTDTALAGNPLAVVMNTVGLTAERLVSFCTRRIGEGHGCAHGGQHCSCSKRTAFPAGLHMLSTGFHRCK
jgi:hypothetical protein